MRPLLLLLATLAPSGADAGFCLHVEARDGPVAALPVTDGEEVRLAFRHSLYGSPVEEAFRVTAEGLRLVRLRYGEERLVEFYGHEAARREGDWWIVETEGPARGTLVLRASPESQVRITVGRRRVPLGEGEEPGRRVRLAVAACGEDGRAR
jgi:hypothetical protein